MIKLILKAHSQFWDKADGFSFLNLINFIMNTLKITQTNQHLHSNNSMIIYIDGLGQFGQVL